MKRFIGWAVSAGLVFAASAAHAQMLAPYRAVSDFDGPYERPYGAVPPAPPPVYDYGQYGGPSLLPPQEVYAILRDNGFSPLGVPTQRGLVYTVAVIDRNGDDGRLVIDARNGRIIRFTPAQGYGQEYGQGQGYGYGNGRGPYGPRPYDQGFHDQGFYDHGFPMERMSAYGPNAALPPPTVIRGTPRPPGSIPQAANRAVPLPAPKPAVAAASPDPSATRSVAPPSVTAHASAAPQASATVGEAKPSVGEAKPAPAIRPTQDMPKVQALE